MGEAAGEDRFEAPVVTQFAQGAHVVLPRQWGRRLLELGRAVGVEHLLLDGVHASRLRRSRPSVAPIDQGRQMTGALSVVRCTMGA
ncbi:hypothetical protein A8W25_12910 [Streptomyces sp. ERV7]|uniref:hypothetical protein n=1 Tax=Streptomyces sp. ERV7 TaxID=1322334 RepID=UPI0007F32987|nr:hypothetical protein [Streptomyces sp. ERV7]OAR26321.1 hypothetical protein A8W25_12910 [Streptomyces sp. ERV7]